MEILTVLLGILFFTIALLRSLILCAIEFRPMNKTVLFRRDEGVRTVSNTTNTTNTSGSTNITRQSAYSIPLRSTMDSESRILQNRSRIAFVEPTQNVFNTNSRVLFNRNDARLLRLQQNDSSRNQASVNNEKKDLPPTYDDLFS